MTNSKNMVQMTKTTNKDEKIIFFMKTRWPASSKNLPVFFNLLPRQSPLTASDNLSNQFFPIIAEEFYKIKW